jgi:ribosomal protein S21
MRDAVHANSGVTPTGMSHNGATVGDLLNLRQFKKRAERDGAAKQAETNRALFGRTKAEKKRDESQAQRSGKLLDGHRIDDETSK